MRPESLRVGSARFRVRPWQHTTGTAYVVPLTIASTLTAPALNDLLRRLFKRGYDKIVTAPVNPPERDRLLSVGFNVHEELIVLKHRLRSRLPARPALSDFRIRRGRQRRDLAAVLRLDADAFTSVWRLDAAGFHEALAATPSSRWRVIRKTRGSAKPNAGNVAGYCVTGRAGPDGYLQRLAVASSHQGRGFGSGLVADALWWLRRAGATSASVNTQTGNERALALYSRCGFDLAQERLAVLHRRLP